MICYPRPAREHRPVSSAPAGGNIMRPEKLDTPVAAGLPM